MALEEAPGTREGAAELLKAVIRQTAQTPLADTPAWKQVLVEERQLLPPLNSASKAGKPRKVGPKGLWN